MDNVRKLIPSHERLDRALDEHLKALRDIQQTDAERGNSNASHTHLNARKNPSDDPTGKTPAPARRRGRRERVDLSAAL